jgi:hypothetical protein
MRQLHTYLPGDEPNNYAVMPSRVVEAAANTALDVYNIAANPPSQKLARIVIQNNSPVPVNIRFNSEATAAARHQVLSAASGLGNGDGGNYIVYPKRDSITRISAFAVGGALKLDVAEYAHAGDIG